MKYISAWYISCKGLPFFVVVIILLLDENLSEGIKIGHFPHRLFFFNRIKLTKNILYIGFETGRKCSFLKDSLFLVTSLFMEHNTD